jgi:hypothetical protein
MHTIAATAVRTDTATLACIQWCGMRVNGGAWSECWREWSSWVSGDRSGDVMFWTDQELMGVGCAWLLYAFAVRLSYQCALRTAVSGSAGWGSCSCVACGDMKLCTRAVAGTEAVAVTGQTADIAIVDMKRDDVLLCV